MNQFIPMFKKETFPLTKTHYHLRDYLCLYFEIFCQYRVLYITDISNSLSYILPVLKGY